MATKNLAAYGVGLRDRAKGGSPWPVTPAVTVGGPSGIPASAKELEKFDLVLMSDVPAHLMGAGQMQARHAYVAQMGGGLIMADGEDSFGSGGYDAPRSSRSCRSGSTPRRSRSSPTSAWSW